MDEQRLEEIVHGALERSWDEVAPSDIIADAIREVLSSQEEELRKLRDEVVAESAAAEAYRQSAESLEEELRRLQKALDDEFAEGDEICNKLLSAEDALKRQEEELRSSGDVLDKSVANTTEALRQLLAQDEALRSFLEERDAHCEAHAEAERILTSKWTEAEARAEAGESEVAIAKNACRMADEAVARALNRAASAEAELQRLREGLWLLPVYYATDLEGTLHRREDINRLLASPVEEKGGDAHASGLFMHDERILSGPQPDSGSGDAHPITTRVATE
jgi:chromosome segregation ATPase